MKKVISLVLALVLRLALCACGAESDKDKLLGTWVATVNLADMINEEMAGTDPTMAEYMKIDNLEMKFVLTFNKNDTCSMVIDEDALAGEIDDALDILMDGTKQYLEDLFADQGLDMPIDDLLDMAGVSLDDLRNELAGELDIADEFADMNFECNFKASKGKLYMSTSLDEEIDENKYDTYELKDGKLIIDTDTNEDVPFFPMTFEKVK